MKRFAYICILILLVSVSSCSKIYALQSKNYFSTVLDGACYDISGSPVKVSCDYYLIYYAADWCPYCKEYSEDLKQTYSRLKRMYGNVEIIFAGHERDTSNTDLESFLRQGNYSFPYVKYEYREKTNIMHLVDVPKFWIPGFVLLDNSGQVLASSNGQDKDAYCRDAPLTYYEAIQQCDCILDLPKL
ncbi:AhpC/TSA family protein [Sphaerochaeta pleomorpha str. Grapes]|uniref:AhpC/TSA family protein n=1 Tax=Sphaerochaeta pleomorpha (strain ATCC BAA-1885 / DSM 22778 / Grapes) TaxID=158190 RepID=G8QVZ0_SPHPG|nr:thioredoxin family protein [Sphaerochaeta pleomorpha]AEV30514.1 AhpC/TSA family protein [Sphaerochaeta pleomorpha str. Grapes]